jgi:hypothetical protein
VASDLEKAYSHRPSNSNLCDVESFGVLDDGTPLHIIDCRGKAAAVANRAAGKGVESVADYQHATLKFCDIGLTGVFSIENTRKPGETRNPRARARPRPF